MSIIKRVLVFVSAALFLLALFGVGVIDRQTALAGLCLAVACLL